MLHISTAQNYGVPEVISPRGIARGQGDAYLLSLNRRIDEAGEPVYVRLMAEMNQTNNAYCAFNANGSSRGASHSTSAFKDAWRRSTLILRGGPVATINAKLKRLQLPAVRGAGDDEELPRPQLSMLWVPQTEGTPNIAANSAAAYWPGPQYVDWVGTDFYSRFPAFAKLERFYAQYPSKPFVFGEWAMWGADTRELHQAVLRLRQLAPAGEDAGVQPGREPERPVPPELAPEGQGRAAQGAAQPALPR